MIHFRVGLDFDGTLNNSFRRHIAVLRTAMMEHDQTGSRNFFESYLDSKRNGSSTLAFLTQRNIPHARIISKKWMARIEDDAFLTLDTSYECVHDAVVTLTSVAKLFLVTARRRTEAVLAQIEAMGLSSHFQNVYVVLPGNEAANQKTRVTCHHQLTHIIGDTEVDLAWAQALRAEFLPLNWGFRSESWWRQKGWTSFPTITRAADQVLSQTRPKYVQRK